MDISKPGRPKQLLLSLRHIFLVLSSGYKFSLFFFSFQVQNGSADGVRMCINNMKNKCEKEGKWCTGWLKCLDALFFFNLVMIARFRIMDFRFELYVVLKVWLALWRHRGDRCHVPFFIYFFFRFIPVRISYWKATEVRGWEWINFV